MRAVIPGKLWVGDQADWERIAPAHDWAVVHACKEPHHREALGYTGRGAPKEHPEYLVARRGYRLILNLVDVDDPKFVAPALIEQAIVHIGSALAGSVKTLVHCNQGRSRSPSIAMLYMAPQLPEAFVDAEAEFRKLYPDYAPAGGMRGFARAHWASYHNRKVTPNSVTFDRGAA